MAKKSLVDDLLDAIQAICFYLPLWAVFLVALVPAVGAFYLVAIIVSPLMKYGGEGLGAYPLYAAGLAYLLSLAAGFSGWKGRRARKGLVARTRSIEGLRALSWREFEMLVGEFYRQQGYDVVETAPGADGGIDIDGTAPGGQRVVIQCKHWRKSSIGVKVVRETLGVLHKIGTGRAIVICTGSFTREAQNFADGAPIELIAGDQLIHMLGSLEVGSHRGAADARESDGAKPVSEPAEPASHKPSPPEAFMPPKAARMCPKCGAKLVERLAKRGPNVGNTFIGCSAFPKCRYTETVEGS